MFNSSHLISRLLRRFAGLVGIVLLTATTSAQDTYSIQKAQRFIQTGPNTVIPDPTAPFTFNASAPIAGVTLTTPTGATFVLPYNFHEEGYGITKSFPTRAALDAAFPNGTYTLSGSGIPTLTLTITGDLYPNTPQLTGGTWNPGGSLILTPAVATTINFSAFTGYSAAGVLGHVYTEFNGADQESFSRAVPGVPDLPVSAQPLTSIAVPASVPKNNSIYFGGIEFEALTSVDTTRVSGGVVIVSYHSRVSFAAAALSSGTGGNPPVITRQPTDQAVAAGASATFTIAVTTGTAAGQGAAFGWYFEGDFIETNGSDPKYSRAANGSLTVKNVTAADVGKYVVQVGNTGGLVISNAATLSLLAAPVISTQPSTPSAVAGGSVTLTVVASGTGNTYQWRKDGAAISGATNSTLTLPNLAAASAGSYTVVVTNSLGTTTSNAAVLTLAAASNAGRLINLSILTPLAAGSDFTMGYVVGGAGTSGAKPLVIRVAGPSLAQLGVAGALSDPKLELFSGAAKTSENDNWGGGAALTNAMASVGAFAFSGPASLDAAAAVDITSRDNSVKVSSVGNSSGTVIAELYEATSAANFTVATPRLVNVSVLKNIGTGLTVGFVIGGSTQQTVLVRAIGPTLGAAPFNVGGAVTDPQLALFSGQNKINENNDWGGTAALSAAFTQVGAFALPAASKDAAILATLAPGNYTVQVSGVNGGTGVALVEVYEVP